VALIADIALVVALELIVSHLVLGQIALRYAPRAADAGSFHRALIPGSVRFFYSHDSASLSGDAPKAPFAGDYAPSGALFHRQK
jgi:hypothetical protein